MISIPNEIFPLVIMTTMENFDVSRIIIDGGSSCDIIYIELFDKLGLKKDKLSPYMDIDIQAFNGHVARPWDFIKIMVNLNKGKDIEMMDISFMAVSCKSVNNCILGRSFSTTLDVISSTVYLKVRYCNVHDEPMTIYANMEELVPFINPCRGT